MKYGVYLGMTESELHTLEAPSMRQLRIRIKERFNWKGYFAKRKSPRGYPDGSVHLTFKHRVSGDYIKSSTLVLIIPRP